MSAPLVCRHGALRRSCETCDLAEDVDRLVSELVEAKRDAERYRWLRADRNDRRVICIDGQGNHYLPRGERLDAMVDTGMEVSK